MSYLLGAELFLLSTNVIIIMQTALKFTLEATLCRTVTVSDLQNPGVTKRIHHSDKITVSIISLWPRPPQLFALGVKDQLALRFQVSEETWEGFKPQCL